MKACQTALALSMHPKMGKAGRFVRCKLSSLSNLHLANYFLTFILLTNACKLALVFILLSVSVTWRVAIT